MFCPKCGYGKDKDSVCSNCGHKTKKKKKLTLKKAISSILIIIIIVCIFIVTYVIIENNRTKIEDDYTASTAPLLARIMYHEGAYFECRQYLDELDALEYRQGILSQNIVPDYHRISAEMDVLAGIDRYYNHYFVDNTNNWVTFPYMDLQSENMFDFLLACVYSMDESKRTDTFDKLSFYITEYISLLYYNELDAKTFQQDLLSTNIKYYNENTDNNGIGWGSYYVNIDEYSQQEFNEVQRIAVMYEPIGAYSLWNHYKQEYEENQLQEDYDKALNYAIECIQACISYSQQARENDMIDTIDYIYKDIGKWLRVQDYPENYLMDDFFIKLEENPEAFAPLTIDLGYDATIEELYRAYEIIFYYE